MQGDDYVKARILKVVLLGAVLTAGAIALTSTAMADSGRAKDVRMYRVTITNAMRGQPVAPSVIATHTGGFHLFHLGLAPEAGDPGYDYYWGLAAMAETGYPFYVLDHVLASPAVWEAKALPYPGRTPPVLLPSESNSTMISASGNAKYLSSVAMIGATNDAVYAVMGVELPKGMGDTVHAWAHAYDIGSEANDESPSTVGALGATDDNPNPGEIKGINENGEGFIHVHAGIHGVGGEGGLDPAMFDWRDPVVLVTVERVE
jgi:hypothetical protein